jgi:hypothetical protein
MVKGTKAKAKVRVFTNHYNASKKDFFIKTSLNTKGTLLEVREDTNQG